MKLPSSKLIVGVEWFLNRVEEMDDAFEFVPSISYQLLGKRYCIGCTSKFALNIRTPID